MRQLSLTAVATLAMVLPCVYAQQLTPHPFSPPSCSADIPPDAAIAACSLEIKDLQQQRSAAKKHATKCNDEEIWADSTRHPNDPDWYVPSARHGSGIPTAGDPHTPDCSGFSAFDSRGSIRTINDQIANDFRARADIEFSQKNFAAAYNDYEESYTTVRNQAVFQARERAHKALKSSRKKSKTTHPSQ